jgi:hypothetical protein
MSAGGNITIAKSPTRPTQTSTYLNTKTRHVTQTGVIPPRGREQGGGDGMRRSDDASRAKLAWLVVGSDMELGKEDVSRISDIVFSAYATCHLCYVSRVTPSPTCTLREPPAKTFPVSRSADQQLLTAPNDDIPPTSGIPRL